MIEIAPATLRDMTFIAANMRQSDREEIYCQLPENSTSVELAAACFSSSEKWRFVVHRHGQPVAAFGFSWINVCALQAWAWGTVELRYVAPAIGKHCLSLRAEAIDAGIRRIEARSLKQHVTAGRWLEGLGFAFACALKQHGRDGEEFILWEWTI